MSEKLYKYFSILDDAFCLLIGNDTQEGGDSWSFGIFAASWQ